MTYDVSCLLRVQGSPVCQLPTQFASSGSCLTHLGTQQPRFSRRYAFTSLEFFAPLAVLTLFQDFPIIIIEFIEPVSLLMHELGEAASPLILYLPLNSQRNMGLDPIPPMLMSSAICKATGERLQTSEARPIENDMDSCKHSVHVSHRTFP
jgi:hypothetical protein